jgi:uncharacterized protein
LPVGVYLFGTLDQDGMRVAIGIVMLVGTIIITLTRQIKSISDWIRSTGYQPGPISGVIAGFLSGLTGGAVSIPGPPMIIYGAFLVETEYWEPKADESDLYCFFRNQSSLQVRDAPVFNGRSDRRACSGSTDHCASTLFLGTWIGIKLFKILPKATFRWFLIIFL